MAGWFGPTGDCTCPCRFSAYFSYGNIAGGCLLYFEVSDLRSGCNEIDFETATITVELRRNGVLITEPLIPFTGANGITGGYWEEWKPTAGDEYTADITLDCGYGNTATGSREFTIPDPANTNCNCCTERVPESVVISGLTGDADILNGTWALEQVSACTYYAPDVEYGEPDPPSDPCVSGYVHTCTQGSSPFYTFYFHRMRTLYPAVSVVMPGTSGNIVIEFLYRYDTWRNFPGCSNTNSGSCAYTSVTWRFEIDCNSGEATLISRTIGGGTGDTTLTDAIPDPTVSLLMAP